MNTYTVRQAHRILTGYGHPYDEVTDALAEYREREAEYGSEYRISETQYSEVRAKLDQRYEES